MAPSTTTRPIGTVRRARPEDVVDDVAAVGWTSVWVETAMKVLRRWDGDERSSGGTERGRNPGVTREEQEQLPALGDVVGARPAVRDTSSVTQWRRAGQPRKLAAAPPPALIDTSAGSGCP